MEQLADICNLSPSYLTKLFKENFNVTPIQYLIKYRIDIASHMLLQSNMRIEDIAFATGFNSVNYFSRTFKSIVGVSPKRYQKEEHWESLNMKETQQLIVRYEMLQ